MKVCMFVLNNCRRDSRVLKEAKTLSDVGHDVRIIAVLDNDTEPYEERDGFRIIRVVRDPVHYRVIRVMSKAKRLITRSRSASLRAAPQIELQSTARLDQGESSRGGGHRNLEPLTVRGYRTIVRHLYTTFTLALSPLTRALGLVDYCHRAWKAVKDEPADVYHSHDLSALPAGYLSRRRTRGNLIYDSHELFTQLHYVGRIEKLLLRLLERHLIRRTDGVVTVNELLASELVRRYDSRLNVVVVRNCPPALKEGSERSRGSLRERLGLDKSVPIVVHVGIFSRERGSVKLVQAARLFSQGVLVFLGWGAEESALQELVRQEGLEGRVFFIPPVAPDQVVAFISSAQLGVIAALNVSLNHYYATPNKLWECIGAGLPVVSSNFPALKEIVEGYRLGCTFDPEYPRDIANAVNYVLSDQTRYEEMKRNALQAAKTFNWEAESLKLLKLYEGFRAGRSD